MPALRIMHSDEEISHKVRAEIFKSARICNDQKSSFLWIANVAVKSAKSSTAIARNAKKLKSREVTVWRTTLSEY